MFDFKFLNADELALLRSKGKVSASPVAANLFSLSLAIIFLLSNLTQINWADLFSFKSYQDYSEILKEVLLIILSSLVIYIFLLILITLLQTRFYFAPGRAFSSGEAFFSHARVFKFLTLKTVAKLTLLSVIFLSAGLIWLDLVPRSVQMLLSEDSYSAREHLVSIIDKILFYCLSGFLLLAFLLIFIAKLAFRLETSNINDNK